ncbi:arsenite methyltransferase [Propionicicella superfundia]|uniref:arsenite methyltransferase n=1 Tax=Propionicicella superfundia TaxID=348582 RepID=UPI0004238E46|nr:arsenite methyltransferase [Propionicicella superfundia]
MSDVLGLPVLPAPRMLARDRAEEYAEWFRTLSDATRVQLLAWIAQHPGGASVKDLTATFPVSQSTISHHLAALVATRFLTVTRSGTQSTYRVNPACAGEMPDAVAILTGDCCADDAAGADCCGPAADATTSCCTPPASTESAPDADIRESVRERYAAIAREASASCCTPAALTPDGVFGATLYTADDAQGAPAEALGLSLGCGVPTSAADPQPGETVLDLGCGAGADVLIAAQRVGPTGRAVGVDMTPEMLDLARSQATRAGVTNAEFIQGVLEDLPLPDRSVDVVISNCVVNLAADKERAIAETFRVLVPGGRLAISDVVLTGDLDEETRADVAQWTGCIAGALTADQYRAALRRAGFEGVSVTVSHAVHDAARSATIRATKPVVPAPVHP